MTLDEADPAVVEIHPILPDLYRKVSAMAGLLDNEDTRPEAMETIRSLLDCIEVNPPEVERGLCAVILGGELASMLAFVAATEDAAAPKGRVEQPVPQGKAPPLA